MFLIKDISRRPEQLELQLEEKFYLPAYSRLKPNKFDIGAEGGGIPKTKQKHSGLTWQAAPPSIQICLHTKKTECSCTRVYVNYVHQKPAPHSSTDRQTEFSLGLNVTLLHTHHHHPKKTLTISWCIPPSVPDKKPRTGI